MIWKIKFEKKAEKELSKLDRHDAIKILDFLENRVLPSPDPRRLGKVLLGKKFGELWRYRVSDYGIVCKIEDGALQVLVVKNRSSKRSLSLK